MSDQQTEQQMRPPSPSASRGAWVTLHLHFPSGQERAVLGYLVGSEGGQYKLTKFVTEQDGRMDTHNGPLDGKITTVHDGVWLINPMYVWMVEHEQTVPVPGFRPIEY